MLGLFKSPTPKELEHRLYSYVDHSAKYESIRSLVEDHKVNVNYQSPNSEKYGINIYPTTLFKAIINRNKDTNIKYYDNVLILLLKHGADLSIQLNTDQYKKYSN